MLTGTIQSDLRRFSGDGASDPQALLIEAVTLRVLQRLAAFEAKLNALSGTMPRSGTY
jgi:hypothetical protein